jgi:hypothetical protein
MLMRTNSGFTANNVTFVNKAAHFGLYIKQLKALQQQTGKPIYLVGVISSINAKGKKVALPLATHYYNRQRFCKVQKQLYKHGIYSINPACLYTFSKAIHVNPIGYNLKTAPNMFNNQCTTSKQQLNAIKRLQRTNRRHATGCCAIVVVHYPFSMASNGVQMELLAALKHNPNVKFYRAY